MALNTYFNDLTGCPLALHKPQVNPVAIPVEAIEFGYRASELTFALFST